MLIGIKNASKCAGVSVICCCAVLVCAMFWNFYLDIQTIEPELSSQTAMIFYSAQTATAKVVCLVSGGCLLATSVVMLAFYIRHYIDVHKKELGLLKALGYTNFKIARSFWTFGFGALLGTAAGFGGAFLLMPWFYRLQNEDHILPEIAIRFHPSVFLCFVVLPALFFAALSIGLAWRRLRQPVLSLLKDSPQSVRSARKHPSKQNACGSFTEDLKKTTLKSKKTLAFFIFFASFCFSSMSQMSFQMKDLSSDMMGIMMLVIGLVLAFTTLFLAVTTVIGANAKTIAMMRVLGYSPQECRSAILGGYRPLSYIGFAVGTVYQHALLRMMVDLVFKDVGGVPVYAFDFPVMLICLIVFLITYESFMRIYSNQIRTISLKELMAE